MQPDRLAGVALMIGAAGAVVTMMFHPSGHESLTRAAMLTVGVHVLAIASFGVQTFGFLRFSRGLVTARPLADGGMVALAFAVVAGTLAATVSGLLTPGLHARVAADPDRHDLWQAVFTYNFHLNAVLTQVFIGAASAAMVIWSAGLLLAGGGRGYLGGVGVVLGTVSLLALLSGHIRNTVHDVGLFVAGFAAWKIALGVVLCQRGGMIAPAQDA